MDHPNQSTVVIGAGGMLGTDLVATLEERGAPSTALGRQDLDIADESAVRTVLNRVRPEVVINAAAYTNVDACETNAEQAFAVNARGVFNVARACRDMGAFMLHVSTEYVFDGLSERYYAEDDPVHPLGVYGKSKAEGERLLRETLPDDHCIVRTQWLFGAHGRNFVEAILERALSVGRLAVVNDQFGSPTRTRDLAVACADLCEKRARGTFHVTNSGFTSWFGFARAIVDAAGLAHVPVEAITSGELDRPAPRPAHAVLDTSKFRAFCGYALRHWEEALHDYLEQKRTAASDSPDD